MMTRARECGLETGVHAIGDAPISSALEAFAGAAGSIEHAQLVALLMRGLRVR
jgi:predicted amidohydrolase YtcJ